MTTTIIMMKIIIIIYILMFLWQIGVFILNIINGYTGVMTPTAFDG